MRYLNAKSKRVALVIETSNEYARGLLRGIKAYNREHKPWSLFLGEHSRLNRDLSWLSDWRGDGILARIENADIAAHIARLGLPTVDLSASRLMPDLPCVETDDEAIAGLAANHLLERGFRQFGYCGDSSYAWSSQRRDFFVRLLREKGIECSVYETDRRQSWDEERGRMAAWLRSLPKPVGIMACYDIVGQQLLEACRLADVSVPEEAGVIGVDNDELLCSLSDPPLSSVAPNAWRTGYEAASLLERMMAGEAVETRVYRVEPVDVVTRLSSDIVAVDDKLVADAVRFIREHAYEDINVGDLLQALPVSRRVLESRFRRAIGRTPHDEIARVKLKLVQRLLAETELTLAAIAEQVGFKHTEYMSVAFKKQTGVSPSVYREQHANREKR